MHPASLKAELFFSRKNPGSSAFPIWRPTRSQRGKWADLLYGGQEEGDRRRGTRRRDHLARDREDVAGRAIIGRGEAETSLETVTTQLAVAQPAKVRPRT
jgi:hypothetical protein